MLQIKRSGLFYQRVNFANKNLKLYSIFHCLQCSKGIKKYVHVSKKTDTKVELNEASLVLNAKTSCLKENVYTALTLTDKERSDILMSIQKPNSNFILSKILKFNFK